MRTYGRTTDPLTGKKTWVVVQTAPDGSNDYVWITTLAQTMLLNLGESPFYANYGIPAKPSIVQQVAPDFYLTVIQQQFARYFASLIISRDPGPVPTYRCNVTTNQGVKVALSIPT